MLREVKLGFLSNFTVDPISNAMKKVCQDNGVGASIYVSPYNQYAQQILDDSSELYNFSPDLVFMLLDVENFLGDAYQLPYSRKDFDMVEYFNEKFKEISGLLGVLKSKTKSKIVVNSLLLPLRSSKGILENKTSGGLRNLIREFNRKLEELSSKDNQLFVFDLNLFCMEVGYDKLMDKRFSYLADMKISIPVLENLAREYMAYIFPLASLSKKCIVLDLDDTLWGGGL